MSKVKPLSLSTLPASFASAMPCGVRSTSVQPVKRFSLFHVLSPWRSRTICFIYRSSASLHGTPYRLGRQRHLHTPRLVTVARARERVDHRVDDRGRRADRAEFADALDAHRVVADTASIRPSSVSKLPIIAARGNA